MKCENCVNMDICKWVDVFNDKKESLEDDTNEMLSVNCSEYDDGKGKRGEANKLQCKHCKFNRICKYQFKLEDSSLRFKTKGCLNIECKKYIMSEDCEIVYEYDDEEEEIEEQQDKLNTPNQQVSFYPNGEIKVSKKEK